MITKGEKKPREAGYQVCWAGDGSFFRKSGQVTIE